MHLSSVTMRVMFNIQGEIEYLTILNKELENVLKNIFYFAKRKCDSYRKEVK